MQITINTVSGPTDREFQEIKQWHRGSIIEDFASNLEIARIIFHRHPELVKAPVFPEPYRSAITAVHGYDPDKEKGLDVGDLHITDPEAADREDEEFARSVVSERREKEREELEAKRAAVLARRQPVTHRVQ